MIKNKSVHIERLNHKITLKNNLEKKKSIIIKENIELASLREFLMQLFMDGQDSFKKNKL